MSISRWRSPLGNETQLTHSNQATMNLNPQDVKDSNNCSIIKVGNWLTEIGVDYDGEISQIKVLNLSNKKLANLPESIYQCTNLWWLALNSNQLTSLPESIGQLTNLEKLYLNSNQLTNLPESIGQLTNLRELDLNNNPILDLSALQKLNNPDLTVRYLGVDLLRQYWTKLSDWQLKWFLNESNAEIRRVFIQKIGYERICSELGAKTIDDWQEYTLLQIENFQPVIERYESEYSEIYDKLVGYEPMVLLKMTCPSTGHIHILRVPPEMTSAEEAITWVNHGIHPSEIAIQT